MNPGHGCEPKELIEQQLSFGLVLNTATYKQLSIYTHRTHVHDSSLSTNKATIQDPDKYQKQLHTSRDLKLLIKLILYSATTTAGNFK